MNTSILPHLLKVTILLLSFVNLGYGANLYSIADGNWTSNTTWSYSDGGTSCSCTPQPSDLIIISHIVVINSNITYMNDGVNASFISIQPTGTLSFEGAGKLNLHTGSIIELDNGGKIRTDNLNDANDKISIGGTEVWRSKCTGSLVAPHCGNVDGPVSLCLDGSGNPSSTCTGFPLPSTLLTLRGSYDISQQLVKLAWTTSNANQSIYKIERSIDGKHFETIKTINKTLKSASIQQFTVSDKYPLPTIGYYRVQQRTPEGQQFSQILTIHSYPIHLVNAYPNPLKAHNTLNLSFASYQGNATINIYNLQGQQVLVKHNVNILPNQEVGLVLPSHLHKGIYIVKVQLAQQTHTLKLFIK